jgi:hypothetical protein
MKISDIACRHCGASYQMAESASLDGPAGQHCCAICGDVVAAWDDGTLKTFRLAMPPHLGFAPVHLPFAETLR